MRELLGSARFRLLFAGLCASMTGESMLLLALAVWVKDLTGSDGMAGATILAIVGPMLFAPLVGWLVDRFRRRPFLVVANVLTALSFAPLYAVRTGPDVWIIYIVGVLYGLSNIAISAALNGLLQEVVPADSLADANGALQTVRQGLRLAGPLAGAGLYALLGGWPIAAVAATGFLVAAVAIAALRVPEDPPAAPGAGWLTEVGAGLRHLSGEPALRRVVVGMALAMLALGFTEPLIFAYVDQGLHRPPAFVGVLVCVQGVGGLSGGLFSAAVVRRHGEIGALALGLALFAPTSAAMAYPALWLGLIAIVGVGLGLPVAVVGFYTLLQRRTPAPLLGRTSAASEALVSGPQAASIAVGAVLVGLVDFRVLYLGMAVVIGAAAGYLWLGRRLSPPAGAQPAASRSPEPASAGVG